MSLSEIPQYWDRLILKIWAMWNSVPIRNSTVLGQTYYNFWMLWFMVLNTTFNNISVISTQSNHWPAASHRQTLSCNVGISFIDGNGNWKKHETWKGILVIKEGQIKLKFCWTNIQQEIITCIFIFIFIFIWRVFFKENSRISFFFFGHLLHTILCNNIL